MRFPLQLPPTSPCTLPDDVIFVNAAPYVDSLCHQKGTLLTHDRKDTGDDILALRKDYRIPEDLKFKNLTQKVITMAWIYHFPEFSWKRIE